MTIDSIVFDMDGVLRYGNRPGIGASDIISFIKMNKIPSIIVSNECRFTEREIRDDMTKMGVEIPETWPIYTAAMMAADFISDRYIKCKKKLFAIGIVGENGLHQEIMSITNKGCQIFEDPPIREHLNIEYILVIGALHFMTSAALEKAERWIRAGAKIITTCPDDSDPGYSGYNLITPDRIMHMLAYKQPPLECTSTGKPNLKIGSKIKTLLKKPNLSNTLFIGDTLATDIKLANDLEMKSCFLISSNIGVQSLKWSFVLPDYICKNLIEVKEVIRDSIEP